MKRPPVAVIGLGSLFPGSSDTQAYWRNILSGRDMVTEVPPSHMHLEHFYDPNPKAVDKTYCKRGAFLSPIEFDPVEFGIPPKNLSSIDSSQLLSLLVAKQVLEDAFDGKFKTMDRSRVGIIMGVAAGLDLLGEMAGRLTKFQWIKGMREAGLAEDKIENICDRILDTFVPWTENTFPGLLGNVVSGRIANHFDLGGINCTSDAACASSFSALSQAMNELYLGNSDVVIVGGADTNNDSFLFVSFSKTPSLSPTHDCRPFSDKADGMVLGEGIAMIALKRLDDAVRAGDRIYAVIRGVGASSDGAGKSIYAPSSAGQSRALRQCYAAASYGPETVELVEAHGTATMVGDAVEFESLKTVFQEAQRKDQNWCALGSVKSQIGHTKSTAATAGIIKAILGLHHKVLPPTIKVDRPNPKLGIENSPFYLNTMARPWIRDDSYPRRASVSSFGFGGSNFHVTLEEYNGPGKPAYRLRNAPSELVLLSGADANALEAICHESAAIADQEGMLPYISKTSQMRFDAASPARLSIVATDGRDLAAKLRYAAKQLAGTPATHFTTPDGICCALEAAEPGPIAFLFPGQGTSGYVGMGSDLCMFFPDAMAVWEKAAIFDNRRNADEALHTIVFPRPVFNEEERIAQVEKLNLTQWAQPAVLTTSIAMSKIIEGLGIKPGFVAGHSLGEISALHAAGVVDFEELLAICFKRAQLMAEACQKPGAMTAVIADAARVQGILDKNDTKIIIANENDPEQVVLSGPLKEMEAIEAALKEENIKSVKLPASGAFHSFLMDEAGMAFRKYLDEVELKPPHTPIFSNVSGQPHGEMPDEIRDQLARQIKRPVRFVKEIEAIYDAGARIFIEVGPGNVLSRFVDHILENASHTTINMDTKSANGLTSLWKCLGKLAIAGVPLDYTYLWKDFAPIDDPGRKKKPVFPVTLSGANYGKKYPSPEGIDSFPEPNPSRPKTSDESPVRPNPEIVKTYPEDVAQSEARQSKEGIMAKPDTGPIGSHFESSTMHEPPLLADFAQPGPSMAKSPSHSDQLNMNGNDSSCLSAYMDIRHHMAQAHEMYLKTMAESHLNFLNAAESSNRVLCAMFTGEPMQGQTRAVAQESSWPTLASMPAPAPEPSAFVPQPPAFVPEPPPIVPDALRAVAEQAQPSPEAGRKVDFKEMFLAVVADKTGYPRDILRLDMNLEADLGIDSIKRVEIFSAVKDENPWLPDIDPAQMNETRTLGDVVAFIEENAGDAKPAPTASLPDNISRQPVQADLDIKEMFFEVVADKTGYPRDILRLDMNLEADLGIDSIKRVEIFSAVKDENPWLPDIDPAQMNETRTLGDVVAFIEKNAGDAKPAPAASLPDNISRQPVQADLDIKEMFFEVVADKTGYPRDILRLDMNLEADLGIDSIKRVEIFSAVKDENPWLPDIDPAQMNETRTLGDVVAFIEKNAGGATPAASLPDNISQQPVQADLNVQEMKAAQIGRYVLKRVSAPHSGFALSGLKDAAKMCIVDDQTGVADELVKLLKQNGFDALVVDESPDDCDGLIFLGGLRKIESRQDAIDVNRKAFLAAKKVGDHLSRSSGIFVTVQDTGGDFGLSGQSGHRAWMGGLPGLVKTAAIEWPKASTKAIDIECGDRSTRQIAEEINRELFFGGPELEVGIDAAGRRYRLKSQEEDDNDALTNLIDKNAIIVASGGARGVTAKALIKLAHASKPRLILLGRTTIKDEPECCHGAASDPEIKSALLAAAKAMGESVSPRALGKMARSILAVREINANLEAMEYAGAKVKYVAVDVLDEARLHAELQQIREQWGPITGIVHGAGVLADKRITEKTMDQFDAVFDIKVKGLETLLSATADDPLTFICLFSSIAGRTGNMGQSDYAMANEVLNKVAGAQAFQRNGDCVVKSINWGPWDGGMVSNLLKNHFKEMGIALIPPDIGTSCFVREIMDNTSKQVEVVVGPKPPDGVLSINPMEKTINLDLRVNKEKYPFIDSHRIQDVPVVPMALVLEWFSKAAERHSPDLNFTVCRDLRFFRGITLTDFTKANHDLSVLCRQTTNGHMPRLLSLTLPAPNGGSFYSAEMEMSPNVLEDCKILRRSKNGLPGWKWNAAEIYQNMLFHGPDFHVIRALEGVSEEKATCWLNGTEEMSWPDVYWLNDVAALDGGLQLAILWGEHFLNKTSLPTGIGAYHRYQTGPIAGPIFCELEGKLLESDRTLSDISFFNREGLLAAKLVDVQMHMRSKNRRT